VSTATEADPRRWRALNVCLIAGFLTMLDVSIVNVALPSIQQGLHASAADLSWVVSGYALTFGLALVPAGRLGDDFGRKPMFITGLGLFVATSALCGFGQNPTWLVVARLLQGVAGGLLNPQVIGMIQQMFRGRERGRAFGLFGTVIGVSTAVGPLVGGLLLQWAGVEHGWRWVFFVNLPVGIVAMVAAVFLLPKDKPVAGRGRIDLLGAVLLGAGVVSLMLPLIEAEQAGANAHWYLLAVGVALLASFVGWEKLYRAKGGSPLINLALLVQRGFSMGTVLGLFYFAGFTGIFFVITLFFQRGLGYSPLAAGAAMLPFAVGGAISSVLAGRVVHRFGRALVVYGVIAVIIGLTATALVVLYVHTAVGLYTLVPLFVAGFGGGTVISPNQTLTLDRIPPAEGGTAAGVLQTAQRIGSAIGTAIAGSLFFGELSGSHGDYPAATSRGLFGSVALVGLALLAGLIDLALSLRSKEKAAPEPAPPTLRIDGTVLTGDEPSGPGTTVTVITTQGRQIAVAKPSVDGDYHASVPEAGRYLVVVSTPGYPPKVSEVDVDTEAAGVDFCFACSFSAAETNVN
jgi:EmrB/QacA subfamily drug resistance transporter